MNTYCFVTCVGKSIVPDEDKWTNITPSGINRLYYIVDGDGGYYLNGRKYHFKKKHLYLIPTYNDIPTWSSYKTPESRLNHLFANFEMIPLILTKDVIELDPHEDPILEAALVAFDKIAESANCNVFVLKEDELRYLKSTIIYIVNKMITKREVKMLDDKVLVTALTKMHKNLSSDISIKEIAEESFMSYYGFIRRFKNALGVTPYAYLKQLRIRTANVLRNEGITLEETAERCGYSDASTLLHAISSDKKADKK